jgi:peptidoglycan/LPS O-acetylase OafA/YrhL
VHYFVYFALGVGVGAVGLHSGLIAADGKLARHWGRWVLAMIGAFVLAVAVFFWGLTTKGQTRTLLIDLGTVTFALSCAASCFGFLAIFTRFARRPSVVWRSASDNSYGIYLVHYAFVAWCQYALLGVPLSGGAKAALVIAAAYPLSWSTAALLRRIPLVAKTV